MKLRQVALVLLAALALGGCGETRSTHLDSRRVTLALDEFRIVPQRVSVPSGRIRILAHNRGILTHSVTVELEHRDAHGNPVILASTATVLPGASATVLTPALAPGRYALISRIANQADLGMTGTMIVR
ncbi:MAG TPA: hypothetical protein VLJ42_08000 [Solirubrobacteraceae bacterium]|nr:hypothetical protein [Solirubrobacteraceae bacterium]